MDEVAPTSTKSKVLSKPFLVVYPLVILVSIPALLILNTILNLRAFNRDVNFIIRHQAIGLADSMKQVVVETPTSEQTQALLESMARDNEDVISASLIKKEGEQLNVIASSDQKKTLDETSTASLSQFALALNQPFAGLVYDPLFLKNVWLVAVPLEIEGKANFILSLKLSQDQAEAVLKRTSGDSFIILAVSTLATLALLANHFLFYQKAIRGEQLAEIDKMKDEFISVASHELRAPVTALVGYLELLKDKIPKESLANFDQEFSTLEALTKELDNLINDLLEVSRIEQGRLKITKEKVRVEVVIEEVIKTMLPLAMEKNLILKTSLSETPEIETDTKRLRQILTNLVNNAVKYTLYGEITVSTLTENEFIKIGVRDTGIGIPGEEVQKLFGKFHRVQDEKTQEVRGTGLGLWITKKLVETLGGKIYVESIYGTGSSFTFTLPKS